MQRAFDAHAELQRKQQQLIINAIFPMKMLMMKPKDILAKRLVSCGGSIIVASYVVLVTFTILVDGVVASGVVGEKVFRPQRQGGRRVCDPRTSNDAKLHPIQIDFLVSGKGDAASSKSPLWLSGGGDGEAGRRGKEGVAVAEGGDDGVVGGQQQQGDAKGLRGPSVIHDAETADALLKSLVLEKINSQNGIQLVCEVMQDAGYVVVGEEMLKVLGDDESVVSGAVPHPKNILFYNHVITEVSITSIPRKKNAPYSDLIGSENPADDDNYGYYVLRLKGTFCGDICFLDGIGDNEHEDESSRTGAARTNLLDFSASDRLKLMLEKSLKAHTSFLFDSFEIIQPEFLPATGAERRRLQEGANTTANCTTTPESMTKFSVTLILLLLIRGGDGLSDDDTQVIGDLFQSSYESGNALNPSLCDPFARIITSTKVFLQRSPESEIYRFDAFDSGYVAVGITVVGSCDQCVDGQPSPQTQLFQGSVNEVVVVPTNTYLCTTCPSNVTQRLPTEDEFHSVFGDALVKAGILVETSDLHAIIPQTTVACSGADNVLFTFLVSVGLEGLSTCTLPLSEDDETQIAGAYRKAYNRLVTESYCDPYFRSLTEVLVVDQATSISEDGTFTLGLQVSGTLKCSDATTGCDVDEIGLYYSILIGNRRRRALQEGVCGCPAYAIAERGPSESDVLVEFQAQVQLALSDFDCQSLQVAQCEDAGAPFVSGLQFTFANGTAAREKSEAEIEAAAIATLMELFPVNSTTTCDPEFRVFSSVRFVFADNRRSLEQEPQEGLSHDRLLQDTADPASAPSLSPTSSSAPTTTFEGSSQLQTTGNLFVQGTCTGCLNDFLSFDQTNGRQLDRRSPLESLLLKQSSRGLQDTLTPVQQSRCFCPIDSNVIDSKPDVARFKALFESKTDLEITETLPIEVEDEVSFTLRVLVGLENLSACTLPLSEEDAIQLADAYRRAYNRLVSELYCDPYTRRLDAVLVVDQATSISEDGTFTLELEVSGTLKCLDGTTGCDVNEIGLFYDPAYPSQDTSNRECPDSFIAERGLSESEVLVELQAQVQLVLTDFDCQSIQVAQCEGVGTLFVTVIRVTFANGTAAQEKSEDEIGAAAMATLSDVYALGSATCNPEFPVFTSVQFVFGNDRRSLEQVQGNPEESRSFRLLQDASTLAPSLSPTSSNAPTFSFNQAANVTQLTGDIFISGSCTGCSNELFASDQTNGRFLVRESPEDSFLPRHRRQSSRSLEDTFPPAQSSCFCPIGSDVIDSRPDITSFETTFEGLVGLEVSETVQLGLNGTTSFDGKYYYPCSTSLVSFRKNVTLELLYTCTGEIPNLSLDDKTGIAGVYVSAYNSLRAGVCDPFKLEITSATVVDVGELRLEGTSLPIEMEVTVNCYGCDPLDTDIFGFPNEDEASLAQERMIRRRVQQQDGLCECDATLPRRSPLEALVTTAMNPALQTLGLVCIGNTTECDFGASFLTSMLLEVQLPNGTKDPVTTAMNLQTAYTNVLTALISGANATQCNALFGFVTDSAFFLDFVYNSVPVAGSNTTDDSVTPSRKLSWPLLSKTSPVGTPGSRRLQDGVDGDATLNLDGFVIPSLAPSSAPSPVFGESLNSTNGTDAGAETSVLIFLQASGVCNGCPQDLVGTDQTSARRGLGESISAEAQKNLLHSFEFLSDEYRFLQALSGDSTESNCYCPIGSFLLEPALDAATFLENFLNEFEKIDNQTTINTESIQLGVRQVDCVEESAFTSELIFEFSAFAWVMENLEDVQGLGDEIAAIYNSLVTEFCDEYFRNSITLTLETTSVQRATGAATRRDEEEHGRRLQQGCLNYQARFLVSGLCRGCASLGTPIPVFGESTIVNNRNLEEEVSAIARDRWQRRQKESLALGRQLQDTSTCICDADARAQPSAPSLQAVRQQLRLKIPTTLPWQAYPSICGLPVATEVPCPAVPDAESIVVKMTLHATRSDGRCMKANDLDAIALAYMEYFNDYKQNVSPRFTCDPNYLQIASITPDYSLLPTCGRRNLLRQDSDRTLAKTLQDHTQVTLTFVVLGNFLASGRMFSIVMNDSRSFQEAGIGVEVRTDGLYFILFEASKTPSMFPSQFPSGFPSDFPSAFPSELSSAPTICVGDGACLPSEATSLVECYGSFDFSPGPDSCLGNGFMWFIVSDERYGNFISTDIGECYFSPFSYEVVVYAILDGFDASTAPCGAFELHETSFIDSTIVKGECYCGTDACPADRELCLDPPSPQYVFGVRAIPIGGSTAGAEFVAGINYCPCEGGCG